MYLLLALTADVRGAIYTGNVTFQLIIDIANVTLEKDGVALRDTGL